eukprot:scaffold46411_cov68-Phaeocystis_antarctica.AAC.8
MPERPRTRAGVREITGSVRRCKEAARSVGREAQLRLAHQAERPEPRPSPVSLVRNPWGGMRQGPHSTARTLQERGDVRARLHCVVPKTSEMNATRRVAGLLSEAGLVMRATLRSSAQP